MKKLSGLLSILALSLALRFYNLGTNPPSLYWDEASLGYNAFSISQTLRDEHGVFLPITDFAAFGDYKPPVYIYITAIFVKLIGLSEFSVRITSASSGVLLALITYFLVNELYFLQRKKSSKTALLSVFIVAVSPWAIQMSRAAFEANLATLFSAGGLFLFLRAIRLKSTFLFALCSLLFALSMYTFNSHRVFVPLILFALSFLFIKDLIANKRGFLLFIFTLVLLLLPLYPHLTSKEGRLRFNEVTWLNNLNPIRFSNERISKDGNTIFSKIIHNRRTYFASEFIKHYTDNLKFDYLFLSGDVNPKLSIRSVGEFYFIDFIFLLAGVYYLVGRKNKAAVVIFSWILLAPVPASLARETPHALRTLNIIPMPQIIIAFGIMYFLKSLKTGLKAISISLLTIFLSLNFLFYLHEYYLHYPYDYQPDWQYGYKQMVERVSKIENEYDMVSVTSYYGRPYIYFLFYKNYSPREYWINRLAEKDNFGFWEVNGFDKYVFPQKLERGKILYVQAPHETINGSRIIDRIYDLNGQEVFVFSERLIN